MAETAIARGTISAISAGRTDAGNQVLAGGAPTVDCGDTASAIRDDSNVYLRQLRPNPQRHHSERG
jgi:hypothetical protein